MGLIRKALSVGTLGVVSFRGKKEQLRRAERSQRDAQTALEREQTARVSAEARILAAEKQVKQASAEAAHAAKRLERTKRRRRRIRKAEGLSEILAGVEPIVRGGVETAHRAGSEAAERGRTVGRRARKTARRAARDVKKRTER